jgi:putative ABC transport system permease protein
MGLKLGDKITMNILGRDITGTITSFRNVDFSTAGIGFIMTMNPYALAGAPHSFIATVYTTPEHEADLLRTLAEAFPNITAIRVKDAIDRVSTVLNSIASATAYGAMATLLTGFLVLIGSAASALHARRYEAAILKTLGATRRSILTSFALRAAMMGASAGIVAIGAGALGGWAVTYFVMETDFSVIWPNAFAVVVGGVLANVLANLAFAMRALNAPAAQILRARE